MKPSEFEISFSVKSYNEKTAENCQIFSDAEKLMVTKLSKISIGYIERTISRFGSRLCQNVTSLYVTLSEI